MSWMKFVWRLVVCVSMVVVGLGAEVSTNTPAHRTAALYKRGVNFGNHLEFERFSESDYTSLDFAQAKREGFDHVRIPVGWHRHTGPGPDFRIDEKFMGVVDRMVEQGRTVGLRVVLNIHHFDELTS